MNLWIKRPVHVHPSDTKRRKVIKEPTLKQKRIAIYGIDRPMPKVKGKIKVANNLGNTNPVNDGDTPKNEVPQVTGDAAYRVYGRCNLNAGSALAKKFPQFAQRGVPP